MRTLEQKARKLLIEAERRVVNAAVDVGEDGSVDNMDSLLIEVERLVAVRAKHKKTYAGLAEKRTKKS